jgi:hypothetical protein
LASQVWVSSVAEIMNSLWIRPVAHILAFQSHLILDVSLPFLTHRHRRLPSSIVGVCDRPHQVFAKHFPLYEVEAMSLIHGQIARLAWPSIMATSRGKVLTLDVQRSGHFAWGPLLVSAGTPEGIGFALRRIFRLQSARKFFPNLSIEAGRVVLISEWGSANLKECLGIQVISMRRTIAC